jgi:hypothetical protein
MASSAKKHRKNFANAHVGKRVPDEYRKPGAAKPVKYTY